MDLFAWFRSPPPIRDLGELADFVDQRAAFLMQKGIYEYARARSGPYAKVMMSEPEFVEAVNLSRWRAYPLGLIMVGEMVEGLLRPHMDEDRDRRRAIFDEFIDLVLAVFDRYPVPDGMTQDDWLDARSELAQRLDQVSTHPPKRVIDIPEPYGKRYFEMMPIHESLRSNDEGTSTNFLKLNLVNMRDDLEKRLDSAMIVELLRRAAAT